MNDNDRFNLFFQLTKVDEQKRLVYGRATQEVPDAVREICDYASSVPYFRKWSDAAKARTKNLPDGAQSLGNVREMHEPIAAGKVIDIQFNDSEKAIDIGTYCADDNTWKKILSGTLTGFSVGGSYAKRWPDINNPSLIRYTANPTEVSYVDSPAVPTAMYTLIKANGTQELRKAGQPIELPTVNENPASPIPFTGADANPTAPAVATIAAGQDVRPIPSVADTYLSPNIIDPDRAVVPGTAARSDPVEKADDPAWVKDVVTAARELATTLNAVKSEQTQAETALKAIGTRVGIARRDGAPISPAADQPSAPEAYGDPANWAWAMYDAAQVTTAIAAFNRGLNKAHYTDREWNILGRRIAHRTGTLTGVKSQYNPQSKQIRGEARKMLQPLNKLDMNMLVSQMQQALNIAVDQIAKDPTAARDMLLAVIGNLDDAASSPSSASTGGSPTPPTGSQAGADVTALKATTSVVSGTTAPLDGGSTTMTASTPTPPPGTGPTSAMINTSAGTTSAIDMDGKATPDGSSTSSSSSASTPTLAAALPAPSSTPSSGGVSAGTPSTDMLKALDDKINTLTETVAKLAQLIPGATTQPANKGTLPAGDLAAMFKRAESQQADPVLTKLLSGDKYALAKAAVAAGTEDRPDLEAVQNIAYEAAYDSLAKSGAFTQLYGRGGPVYTPAPAQQ